MNVHYPTSLEVAKKAVEAAWKQQQRDWVTFHEVITAAGPDNVWSHRTWSNCLSRLASMDWCDRAIMSGGRNGRFAVLARKGKLPSASEFYVAMGY